MKVTTERVAAGSYRVYDEDGYSFAIIRKADKRTRPWIITYVGGKTGGATPTLKAAVQRINDRLEE